MIRIHCAVVYLIEIIDSATSVSIQDHLANQSNVGLAKHIRLLFRFKAPQKILSIPFITASNFLAIGINSSTSTSLLIALTDSASSKFLSRSWTLSDRHYLFLVFTSLVFAFFVSFSVCYDLQYIFALSVFAYPSPLLFRHLHFRSWASTRTSLLLSCDATTRSDRLWTTKAICYLSFSVCVFLFILSVNTQSGARLE